MAGPGQGFHGGLVHEGDLAKAPGGVGEVLGVEIPHHLLGQIPGIGEKSQPLEVILSELPTQIHGV